MAYKPMFGSRKREALWCDQVFNAQQAGLGDLPICNICDKPVPKNADWHESHLPFRGAPAHLRRVGVAHAPCNLEHGAKVVVPMLAKAKRLRRHKRSFTGPKGRYPMRAGFSSRITKTMHHGVRPRLTHAQKHAATMAARAIVAVEVPSPPIAEV